MGVKSLCVEKHSPKYTISAYKEIQRAWLAPKAGCVPQEIAFTMLYNYIYLLHDL